MADQSLDANRSGRGYYEWAPGHDGGKWVADTDTTDNDMGRRVEPATYQSERIYQGNLLADLGKDAPIVEQANGARSSQSPYFTRGLPPLALLAAARVFKDGAVGHEDDPFGDVTKRNWHKISSDDNFEHAFTHMIAYLSGDTGDQHLEHALARLMMAVHMKYIEIKEAP